MALAHSFPAIETPESSVLVLGTMPGMMSLQAQQYYAHPRNGFWKICGEVLGFDPGLAYDQRRSALAASGVALWDVLQSCTREGSLDANIDHASVVPNNFADFFAWHAKIRLVCFNGATAERLYQKLVLPGLACATDLAYLRLPSTSPANAGTSYSEKLLAWRAISPARGLSG